MRAETTTLHGSTVVSCRTLALAKVGIAKCGLGEDRVAGSIQEVCAEDSQNIFQ